MSWSQAIMLPLDSLCIFTIFLLQLNTRSSLVPWVIWGISVLEIMWNRYQMFVSTWYALVFRMLKDHIY